VRDLRSTVVVTSAQAEQNALTTRTIRNYNHSHAMTVLYYEVLRHYRVVVERGNVIPVVLIPQDMPDFDVAAVFNYRRFLEGALLDPELAAGFDAIEKYYAWQVLPQQAPPDPGAAEFVLFNIFLTTGTNVDDKAGKYQANAVLMTSSGSIQQVPLLRTDGGMPADDLYQGGMFVAMHSTDELSCAPQPGATVPWRGLLYINVFSWSVTRPI
jgi:hypothetical protein